MKAVAKKDGRLRNRKTPRATTARIDDARRSSPGLRVWATAAVLGGAILLGGGYFVWNSYTNSEIDYSSALRRSSVYRIYQAGIAMGAQGKFKEAELAFQRALSEDSGNALIYNALATTYINSQDYQKALRTAEEGVIKAPGSPDLLYTLGIARFQLAKYDDAVKALERALELRPTFPRASLWLGNSYMMLARSGTEVEGGLRPELLDEAIGHFETALAADDSQADVHSALAEALFQKRELEMARSHFQRAYELDRANEAYAVALGKVCEQLGEFDAARAAFESATQVESRHKEAYFGLGLVATRQGRDEDAIAAFRKTVEIDPFHVDAHQHLAEIYARLGRAEESQNELALVEQAKLQAQQVEGMKQALLANPENADLAVQLGTELAKRGDYDAALGQFQRSILVAPEHVDALYRMAGALLLKGRIGDALNSFNTVEKLKPGFRQTNRYLAEIYEKLGQQSKAAEYQRKYAEQQAAGTATADDAD